MQPKGEYVEGVPSELQGLLDKNQQAKIIFESLAKSYKKGYCNWIGSAKQEETRKIRAEKALKMLQNDKKTQKK